MNSVTPSQLKAAIDANPNDYAALNNLAQLFLQVGDYPQALKCYWRAYQIRPNEFEIVNGLGTALRMNGDMKGAIRAFITADRLNPHSAKPMLNVCALYNTRGVYPVADNFLHQAKQREPDFTNVHWFEAMRLLRHMDYRAAWPLFEVRFELQGQKATHAGSQQPRWQPNSHAPLVLLKEQGFGDVIQMLRFIPQLAQYKEIRAVEVPPELQRLAEYNHPTVTFSPDISAQLTDDVEVLPLLSMGHALNLAPEDIPSGAYWQAIPEDIARWQHTLAHLPRTKPTLAFYWAGNPQHANDAQRSLPVAFAQALTQAIDANWIIIQRGVSETDKAGFNANCTFMGDDFKDFADTAAVLSVVDLLIGVDSSPVHLAGALGVPTWLMLPVSPDWRWGLNQASSVWYDSMTLFRQSSFRQWTDVVNRIVSALAQRYPHSLKQSHIPSIAVPDPYEMPAVTAQQQILLSQAKDLINDKQYAKAKRLLTDFFKQRDDVPFAFALLSHCLCEHDPKAALREALYGLAWQPSVECLLAIEKAATKLKDYATVKIALMSLQPVLPKDDNLTLRLGNTCYELGDYQQALDWYRITHDLNPKTASPWTNSGFVYKNMGRMREAETAYRKALDINPNDADTHWNLALLHLLNGDYEQGLKESEWRWLKSDFPSKPRGFKQPLWMGEKVERLFVHAEQGFGDCLQMLRYVPIAASKVNHLILEMQPELIRLMQVQVTEGNLFPTNVTIVAQKKIPDVDFDAHVPMMTLPLSLGLFDMGKPPLTQAHLSCKAGIEFPDAQQLHRKLNVGFVWRGRPTFAHNHLRSFTLTDMQPLFKLPNIRWFSLQKTPNADIASELKAAGINAMDLGARAQDFLDTATYLKSLDLFITTDTSVAHLAGALGVPTWVAVMAIPDWRWAPGGERCVWYDSIKIYRQDQKGDWSGVFAAMTADLLSLLESTKA